MRTTLREDPTSEESDMLDCAAEIACWCREYIRGYYRRHPRRRRLGLRSNDRGHLVG